MKYRQPAVILCATFLGSCAMNTVGTRSEEIAHLRDLKAAVLVVDESGKLNEKAMRKLRRGVGNALPFRLISQPVDVSLLQVDAPGWNPNHGDVQVAVLAGADLLVVVRVLDAVGKKYTRDSSKRVGNDPHSGMILRESYTETRWNYNVRTRISVVDLWSLERASSEVTENGEQVHDFSFGLEDAIAETIIQQDGSAIIAELDRTARMLPPTVGMGFRGYVEQKAGWYYQMLESLRERGVPAQGTWDLRTRADRFSSNIPTDGGKRLGWLTMLDALDRDFNTMNAAVVTHGGGVGAMVYAHGPQVLEWINLYGSSAIDRLIVAGEDAFERGSPALPPRPVAEVSVPRSYLYVEKPTVHLIVGNTGRGTMYLLQASIDVQPQQNAPTDSRLFIGKLQPGDRVGFEIELANLSMESSDSDISIKISFTEQNDYIPEDVAARVHIEPVSNATVLESPELFSAQELRKLASSGIVDRRAIDRLVHFDLKQFDISDIVFLAEHGAISQDIVERVLLGESAYSNNDLIRLAELRYVSRDAVESLFRSGRPYSASELETLTRSGVFGKPNIGYAYTIDDSDRTFGNNDGRIQIREAVKLNLALRNDSPYELHDLAVSVTPRSSGVDAFGAEGSLSVLSAKTTFTFGTTLAIKSGFTGDSLSLVVQVDNDQFGDLLRETLTIPIGQEVGSPVVSLRKQVVSREPINVYAGADRDSSLLAAFDAEALFDVVGELSDYLKVNIFGGFGWIQKNLVDDYRGSADTVTLVSDIDEEARVFQNAQPEVVIRSPRNQESVNADSVFLELTAIDRAFGISTIDIRVNGEPISSSTPRGIDIVATDPHRVEQSYQIHLTRGRNEVTVVAYNRRNFSSEVARVVVNSSGRYETPKLYVFSIGVSDYKLDRFDLRYPAVDARTIAELFVKQNGSIFSDVITRVIVDSDATRERIEREARAFGAIAQPQDVVIFFLAGHGVQSRGSYFFIPYDANPLEPSVAGIREEAISDWLYGAAKKAIVMIDTCQSALLPGQRGATESQMDQILKRLNDARGVVCISASRGDQAAQERTEWGHGAFTLAVEEGLSGGAARDTDGDGAVGILELYDFVFNRVVELTHGEQIPVISGQFEPIPIYVR